MKTGRAIVITAGCMAGLLLISNAGAVSAGYNGITCRYPTGTSFPYLEGIVAEHRSASSGTFLCSAAQLGGAISTWRASVGDWSTIGEVRCFARATGEFDIAGFVSASEGTGIGFMGQKTLGLTMGGTAGFIAKGSKLIQCSLPAAGDVEHISAVHTYSISEL